MHTLCYNVTTSDKTDKIKKLNELITHENVFVYSMKKSCSYSNMRKYKGEKFYEKSTESHFY